MAETRAYARTYATLESNMGAILSRVNNALVKDLDGGQYVTLLLARLDPRNRSIKYASAGHIPYYLRRPCWRDRARHREHGSTVRPLCRQSVLLQSGHSIGLRWNPRLLTDGITETANNNEAQFGAGKALEFIKCHPQNSATERVRDIHETVRAFTGGAPPSDDITSVICQVSRPAMEASL
jgi:sigma-B regulation protein RsbU (phosphoserine phosphatase)